MNARLSGWLWDFSDMQKHFKCVVPPKYSSGMGKTFPEWPFWKINTTATLSKLLLRQCGRKASYTLRFFGQLYWVRMARFW